MITLSYEQAARLLVGREVKVSVGEPWDFQSPDGSGVLNGRIEGVAGNAEEAGSQWLTLKVTPFEGRGGRTVTRLAASQRHEDSTTLIEQMAVGERVSANLSYEDQVPKEDLPSGQGPYLIGSVQLAH